VETKIGEQGEGQKGKDRPTFGGLSSWGLDPLELSLTAIDIEGKNGAVKDIKTTDNDKIIRFSAATNKLLVPSCVATKSHEHRSFSKSITKTALSAFPSTSSNNAVDLLRIKAHIALSSNNKASNHRVRGLDADFASNKPVKRVKPNATVIHGVSALNGTSSGVVDEVQQLLEKFAPCCPGHQMGAKLCVVKKVGANKVSDFQMLFDKIQCFVILHAGQTVLLLYVS
jgi:hypothetical protein